MVREDELLVKNVLEYFVYGRHSLEVGDNYALLLPDIYTKNHDVGIEVVNAELYVDQRKKSFFEYYLENNYTEKQKQILRMLANAQAFDIPAKLWLKTLIGEEKYKQYQDYVAFAKKKGDLHEISTQRMVGQGRLGFRDGDTRRQSRRIRRNRIQCRRVGHTRADCRHR